MIARMRITLRGGPADGGEYEVESLSPTFYVLVPALYPAGFERARYELLPDSELVEYCFSGTEPWSLVTLA